jgi:hypothetical protein
MRPFRIASATARPENLPPRCSIRSRNSARVAGGASSDLGSDSGSVAERVPVFEQTGPFRQMDALGQSGLVGRHEPHSHLFRLRGWRSTPGRPPALPAARDVLRLRYRRGGDL